MRCKVCDTLLDDNELTWVDVDSGEHLDLCSYCIGEDKDDGVSIPFVTELEYKEMRSARN